MNKIWVSLLSLLAIGAYAEDVQNTSDAGYTLVLEEDLRFGVGEEEETLWSSPNTKILPGLNGEMYIFDVAESRVLVFDRDGQFVRQATGKGDGPGELHMVLCVTQAADGTILVMDVNPGAGGMGVPRIMRYKNDMTFLDTVEARQFPGIPALVNVSPDGKHLAGVFAKVDFQTMSGNLITGVVNIESGEMVNELGKVPMAFPDPKRMGESSMWEDFLAQQFKILYSFGMVTFTGNGKAYAAVSDEYSISRWAVGGEKPEKSFSRTYQPIAFDEKAREAMVERFFDNLPNQARSIITKNVLTKGLEKAELPPRKAPLAALLPLEDKAVIAVHDVNMETRNNIGDVFDLEGRYLCSFNVPDFGLYSFTSNNPTPRMVFRDGYAYTIHTTVDDEQIAVRYKYALNKP